MDIWSLFIALIILLIFIYLFFRLARSRKGGGAATFMIMSGATDALMDKNKKKAVEIIVERNAQKKVDEQSTSDPGIKEGEKTE